MHTFNNNTGRVWNLSINVASARRVLATPDIDLLQAVEGKLSERIAGDPNLLCDVI